MRPVLFELGPLDVKAYGTFIVLAFVAAGLVLRHEPDRRGARGHVAGHLAIASVGGFVGARAYWLLEHAKQASLGDAFSTAGFLPGTAASSAARSPCC